MDWGMLGVSKDLQKVAQDSIQKIVLLTCSHCETNIRFLQLLPKSEAPANTGGPTEMSIEGSTLVFLSPEERTLELVESIKKIS